MVPGGGDVERTPPGAYHADISDHEPRRRRRSPAALLTSRARPTIRARLTLLYAAAFFVAGAVLVAIMYVSLQRVLENNPVNNAITVLHGFFGDDGMRAYPLINSAVTRLSAEIEQQRSQALRSTLVASLVSLAGMGVAAGGFGWLLAGRVLRPLQQVTGTAQRIADHNLHERIALQGPADEIKELADTFDAMLDRLAVAFDVHQRFVANASHELRTPLAINRTLIEVALDDPDVPDSTRRLGETLLAVNKRHERLIDGLLVLASSERALDSTTLLNLADVAGTVLSGVLPLASRAGVRLSSDLGDAAVIGDPALLERLVGNLIDNAVRYNVDGGWVHVTVNTTRGWSRLTVQNTGPVVEQGDVGGLFDRFRRLSEDSSGGAGLGLSIVRSVTTAHRGQVRATAHPQGGLTVEVILPSADGPLAKEPR